jgi:hypothetical protein
MIHSDIHPFATHWTNTALADISNNWNAQPLAFSYIGQDTTNAIPSAKGVTLASGNHRHDSSAKDEARGKTGGHHAPMPCMTRTGTGRHHTVPLCTADRSTTTASYRLASLWNRLLTTSPPVRGMCVCVCVCVCVWLSISVGEACRVVTDALCGITLVTQPPTIQPTH